MFLQFPNYVPVSDGGWHHVAVSWSSVNGTLTLFSDGLIGDKREQYGVGRAMPPFGFVTLGSTDADNENGRTRTESGFHGKLTRVQVWNRALSLPTVQQQV